MFQRRKGWYWPQLQRLYPGIHGSGPGMKEISTAVGTCDTEGCLLHGSQETGRSHRKGQGLPMHTLVIYFSLQVPLPIAPTSSSLFTFYAQIRGFLISEDTLADTPRGILSQPPVSMPNQVTPLTITVCESITNISKHGACKLLWCIACNDRCWERQGHGVIKAAVKRGWFLWCLLMLHPLEWMLLHHLRRDEQMQMNMSPSPCGHQRPHQALSRWPLSGNVHMWEGSGTGRDMNLAHLRRTPCQGQCDKEAGELGANNLRHSKSFWVTV